MATVTKMITQARVNQTGSKEADFPRIRAGATAMASDAPKGGMEITQGSTFPRKDDIPTRYCCPKAKAIGMAMTGAP